MKGHVTVFDCFVTRMNEDPDLYIEGKYYHESQCIDRLSLEIYLDLLMKFKNGYENIGWFSYCNGTLVTWEEYHSVLVEIKTLKLILS